MEKGHLPQSQLKKEEAEVKVVARDMKGWVWWGRPMWHDMGYLAVRPEFPSSEGSEADVPGDSSNVCCDYLLGIIFVSAHLQGS